MQKIPFQDLPDTTTPINATNLNAMQTNAETAINDVVNGTVNNATKWNNRQDKISQSLSDATTGTWVAIVDADGNIKHITIGEIMTRDDSGWITLNSIIKYRKVNNIVYIVCNNGGSVTVPSDGSYHTIGTLPTGYRPSIPIAFASHTYSESSKSLIGEINTSGEIKIYANVDNKYFGFSVSFPI